MVVSPIFTTWTCPWSKVLVSSGLSKLLFVTLIAYPLLFSEVVTLSQIGASIRDARTRRGASRSRSPDN